jgi:hypothetical protein
VILINKGFLNIIVNVDRIILNKKIYVLHAPIKNCIANNKILLHAKGNYKIKLLKITL